MNDEAFARFESEAAEILGALKHLFREFERQLGEAVSAQRLESSEARAEAADARAILRKVAQRAEQTANEQHEALEMLRENWWFNIEENAKASGAHMALTFGEEIAAGLEKKLKVLSAEVERATRRLGWMTTLKWGAGVAAGVVITILIAVYALTPQVAGLSSRQVQAAIAEIVPCQVDKRRHVCIKLDARPRLISGSGGVPVSVIRGL
jgi:hypothetical protein